MVPFWNPVLESATVCPLSMSWSTWGLLWEHRKPQVKVNHRRDRSHHIHVQSLEHQETYKMRILEWSQEVDLQLLAVPSPGFSTFVILKMQVIKLSYTIPFGGRICLILSPWLFSGGQFVRWILWSLNCELWCICCLLRCITFFFYSVKKGSGLLSHFFFFFFITTTSNNHGENVQTVGIHCKAIYGKGCLLWTCRRRGYTLSVSAHPYLLGSVSAFCWNASHAVFRAKSLATRYTVSQLFAGKLLWAGAMYGNSDKWN